MYMEQEEVGLNKADSIINFITNSYPGCCYLHPQVHKFMVAPHSHKCLEKKRPHHLHHQHGQVGILGVVRCTYS